MAGGSRAGAKRLATLAVGETTGSDAAVCLHSTVALGSQSRRGRRDGALGRRGSPVITKTTPNGRSECTVVGCGRDGGEGRE